MSTTPIYDLPADVEFSKVDPAKWRSLPEPEGQDVDDDEDLPATPDVIAALGFNPDELWGKPPTKFGGPGSGITGHTTDRAEAHVDGILARAKSAAGSVIPQAIKDKARAVVGAIKDRMEARYGPKWTKAIIGAGLTANAIPVPGASPATFAAMFAAAEAHRAYRSFRPAVAHAEGLELTAGQVQRLGKSFMAEVLARMRMEATPHAERIGLPDQRQDDNSRCGAAAVQAVLQQFGIVASEDDLAEQLGTTREAGTDPAGIVRVLCEHGLRADPVHGMTVAFLSRWTAVGRPVLTPVQLHGSAAGDASEENGHWVAVVGVNDGQVKYQDPSRVGGGKQSMPEAEWLAGWHDRDGSGNRYRRFGIIVSH